MISNLDSGQVQHMGYCFRKHWEIENCLHWMLGVNFREDENRTRQDNGTETLGKIQRLAMGLMRKVKGKQTIPNMMFRAALLPGC
jgi:predicted transposase YbfD/YdcC